MAVQGGMKSARNIRRLERRVAVEAARPAPAARARHLVAVDDAGPGGDEILRFDGRSGRLSPNARLQGFRQTSAGSAPTLTVQVTSEREETVISAELLDTDGQPVRPASIVAVVVAEGVPPAPEQPMHPATAPGGRFELRLRTSARLDTLGWAVRARGALDGQRFDRVAAGAFQAQMAGGRIDASAARVEQRGADLELSVQAEIETPGTYWMYAELWGGAGAARPIAFSRRRFEDLTAGAHPLALSFAGGIIRHGGIDGPYLVRNLRLQPGDGMAEEPEPIRSLPPTAPYRASDFGG